MKVHNGLIGQRFGRLTIVSHDGFYKNGQPLWKCVCDCGVGKTINQSSLLRGLTKSCGCLHRERTSESHLSHGQGGRGNRTPEYIAWSSMKTRCYNPDWKDYDKWGGRGIMVCDRWLNSFENFLEDMGKRPSPKHSLDRFPDVNGNYEPSNCRWATILEQSRCKRNNHWLEHNGVKMIIEDWGKFFGVRESAVRYWLKKGKSFDEVYDHFNDKLTAKVA